LFNTKERPKRILLQDLSAALAPFYTEKLKVESKEEIKEE